jgi:hypothetical protein
MDVQINGRTARFADLRPGAFFCALRAESLFGICVTDGTIKGALLFSEAPRQSGIPWLVDRGLPNDAIVMFPSAVMKADLSSVSATGGSPPFGAVISSGEDYLIRASAGLGDAVTFNLSTGMIVEISTQATSIVFPNWQIGHCENHKFEPLFSFKA